MRVAAPGGGGPFRNLWLANAGSNLGDGLYQVALPLLALDLTRSPTLIAGVTIALTFAWPVFGLHAGSVVDRFDRRRILVVVSVLRAVVLVVLTTLILSDSLSIAAVYLAALVLGVGETLADTALTALVPAMVQPDRLEWANGRIVAGQTILNSFAGPPLAGALLAIGHGVVTATAGALYGVAGLALGLVRGSYGATAAAQPQEPVNRRVTEGFRFLWRHALLRKLTLFTAAMNVWWAAWTSLFVVYAVEPGPMGLPAVGFGLILTAMAVGGLAGSMAADWLRRTIGTRNALALDLVGTVCLVGVPALTTDPVLVGLATFAAGFGGAVWVVIVSSVRQRLTPNALLGRAYSASRMISWGILPFGAALGGLGAELFGVPAVFGLGALVSIGLLVVFQRAITTAEVSGAPFEA